MKESIVAKKCADQWKVNRYIYGIYMILVVFLFVKGDYEWAFTNLGIAMLFDPFNPEVKFTDRPLYQKMWLYIHLALTLGGLIFLVIQS